MTKREFIKSLLYFTGLDDAVLDSISQSFFERRLERGEIIQFEGEPVETLFFIDSGAVKVFKTSASGKEQILSITRQGESFNDIAIFDDGPSPASVETMTPVVLYGIDKDKLHTIIDEHCDVARNTIRLLAERTRQLLSLVEDLSFRRVISRVARLLLENASNGTTPGTRFTQQEMAALVGSAREVVARSLKALEAEGAIRLDRQRIRIIDRNALETLVESSV